MATRRGRKLAVAALLGAAGLLAWLDLSLLQGPVDISPVAPPPGKAAARPGPIPPPATALDKRRSEQLNETVARPLFNPTRRPMDRPEAVAVRPPKVEPAKLRLVGVMKPDGAPPRALIRFADDPTGRWVAEGSEYHGWTLTKVNEGSVIVEAGGRTQELLLFIPPPPQKIAPAPPPAAPPQAQPAQAPQEPSDTGAEPKRRP
jgi:hypothetical protein